ncbi:MAG TPA: oxygenase MpaB family protein [Mycobacteriales bacterium]|nr:oxygenase MpaB family protein [Mycobacteriales bacterium]
MTVHYPELAKRVIGQAELQPDLYGGIDFTRPPYRHTTDPAVPSALPSWLGDRERVLRNERVVELIRTATMLGDVVADPYASLVDEFGLRGLTAMLTLACREGIDAVPDAPEELRALIASMEATPDWVDMRVVEEGARQARIPAAFVAPFIIRGVFLGTFINSYAALPMALTGALSGARAAHRVNETSSFFSVTTMPGALERYGPGFAAAAMVRLMHSMVRFNALKRSDKWDAEVYGMPVPQVDQMPAGLINVYMAAAEVLKRGDTQFTDAERAVVDFSRYRCFLLGLPDELLPSDPREIVDVFNGRGALLRDGFDDATCGELVRSTMAAYVRPGHGLVDRALETVEKSWSRVGFVRAFCNGDRGAAERMGVRLRARDVALVGLTSPFIIGRNTVVTAASKLPALRGVCDRYAIRVLKKRLKAYGTPEFTTDHKTYPAELDAGSGKRALSAAQG